MQKETSGQLLNSDVLASLASLSQQRPNGRGSKLETESVTNVVVPLTLNLPPPPWVWVAHETSAQEQRIVCAPRRMCAAKLMVIAKVESPSIRADIYLRTGKKNL